MIRYFGLLICLLIGTVAHAYNETIVPIAYNPSRLGAYDYLKVNIIKLQGGLRALGNTTEINLFGDIDIWDNNSDAHQYKATDPQLNTITNIKPLSNYAMDLNRRTFCTQGQSWISNTNACSGNITLQTKTMMGFGNPVDYNGTSADPDLIPDVYIYGGTISLPSSGLDANLYSRIQTIRRMYISGSTLNSEEDIPPDLSLNTQKLAADNNNSFYINVIDKLAFQAEGMVEIPVTNWFDACKSNYKQHHEPVLFQEIVHMQPPL